VGQFSISKDRVKWVSFRVPLTAFLDDRKTQQAVIYNIMIIGEAATQLINEYPDFVAIHPDIPWREMRGIRNRMAHGYYELDLTIIWDTVTTYLDRLIQQIASAKNCSSSD
jgi:uncharacterized protein with HEPN domain